MRAQSITEVIDAAHLSKYVQSPFKTRGGILLIGPPETLRTTIVENSLSDYPDAKVLCDLNVRQLMDMWEDLSAGKITTLAFTEFAKLYARNPNVARNIEMHILQMVEEGMSATTIKDQRMSSTKARALVIAACSEKFYATRFTEWMDSGFARRFLHCSYRLADPWALADAQQHRMLIDLGNIKRKLPANRSITWIVDEREMKEIRRSLKHQFSKGVATPFHLAANIFCVLKWKYDANEAMRIWRDFGETMQEETAMMDLPPLEVRKA
jgi:hypothetical protein